MLTHGQIWRALDRLAEQHSLSTSGLAKKAGLDPTTFNRSKRVTGDGRPRWPSTESIAKALAATGAGVEDFVALLDAGAEGFAEHATPMEGALVSGGPGAGRVIPLLELAHAGAADAFDGSGRPAGPAWDGIVFPELDDAQVYALEICGPALAPVYRDRDVLVVSPAAAVRRGDRVVVKARGGALLFREFLRRTARQVEVRALGAPHETQQLPLKDVAFIARIVWSSQ
jgi:phage repressor protein C with HTH and peptisase S24 domain